MSTLMIDVNDGRAKIHDDLVASGSVIEMRYRDSKHVLSLRAGKMLHLLVKAANSSLSQHIKHTIRLAEIKEVSRVGSQEIRDIAHELSGTTVELRTIRPFVRSLIGPILDHVDINEGDKTLIFRFSETMVSVFLGDDRWTILSRKIVMAFESRYALRLFEMLSLRRGFGRQTETFELSDLRSRLGVEQDKLKSFDHFRSKCLDAAIAEVQRAMQMDISYTTVKTGKAVSAITLSWSDVMSGTVAADAKPTRGRGRPKAAITLAADDMPAGAAPEAHTVAAPPAKASKAAFPSNGIRYAEPWDTIARQYAPGWDVDIVAATFRDFCIKAKIPLNTAAIEGTFVGFCKSFVEKRKTAPTA